MERRKALNYPPRPGVFQGYDVVLHKLDSDGNRTWSAPAIVVGRFAQQSYSVTVADNIAYVGAEIVETWV